jgi:histidine triad (HIT) family protein
MENNCVFCKIIRGELPCVKLYEDDKVIVFLDIAPISKGHALVVPKEHHVSITSLTEPYREAMMRVAPEIGAALMRTTDSDGFNFLLSNGQCAGQVVPHVHLHVIPRKPDDAFSMMPPVKATYADDAEKEAMAAEVRKRMES